MMDELLALEPGVCPGEAWNKASSTENMEKDKSQDMPAEVCNKAEEETLSEISLDSHGFRNMLRSPDRSKNKASGSKSGLKQSPAKKQELLSKKGKSHRETLELQAANAAEKLAVATPKKAMKTKKDLEQPRPSQSRWPRGLQKGHVPVT